MNAVPSVELFLIALSSNRPFHIPSSLSLSESNENACDCSFQFQAALVSFRTYSEVTSAVRQHRRRHSYAIRSVTPNTASILEMVSPRSPVLVDSGVRKFRMISNDSRASVSSFNIQKVTCSIFE